MYKEDTKILSKERKETKRERKKEVRIRERNERGDRKDREMRWHPFLCVFRAGGRAVVGSFVRGWKMSFVFRCQQRENENPVFFSCSHFARLPPSPLNRFSLLCNCLRGKGFFFYAKDFLCGFVSGGKEISGALMESMATVGNETRTHAA